MYESKGSELSGADLFPSQKFCEENFFLVIDRFAVSLQQRQAAFIGVSSLFGSLHDLDSLNAGQIEKAAVKLVITRKNDLDRSFGFDLI